MRPAPIHCSSRFLFFLNVVTPNLSRPWQANERPFHVWQLISLAGGKQLDTQNGGWQRSDAERARLSCICIGGGGFVWKHFKNNTLYCGDSFQPATFHYGFERWGWQGRVCWGARPLLFNLSSTPWRPPPTQLPSPHALLHLPPIHGCTPVQVNGSRMNRKKWENHQFFLTPKNLCNSRGSRREMICSTKQDLPQHS